MALFCGTDVLNFWDVELTGIRLKKRSSLCTARDSSTFQTMLGPVSVNRQNSINNTSINSITKTSIKKYFNLFRICSNSKLSNRVLHELFHQFRSQSPLFSPFSVFGVLNIDVLIQVFDRNIYHLILYNT